VAKALLPKVEKPDSEEKTAIMPNMEHKYLIDAGFQYEKDLQVGFLYSHVDNKFDSKKGYTSADEIEAGAIYNVDGGHRVWGGYDHVNKFVKLGGLYKHDDDTHIAKEVRYHFAGNRQCMGMDVPVSVAVGKRYKASKDSTVSAMVELGAKAHAMMSVDHKVDNNWSVAVNQSFDCNKKSDNYQLGFGINYKL